MPTLPPWLQISPEQFTQAAIAGGQQGYQAAGQAAELAQRGTLAVAQMAQEAAQRAAEIRLRREQINAELARNAANVAAARYNAALDFDAAQNALAFAREREANAVAQNQAQLAAQQQMTADELAVKRELGLADIATPRNFEPPQIIKLQQARDAATALGTPEGSKRAAEIQGQIDRLIAPPSAPGLRISGVPLDPNNPMSRMAVPTVSGPEPLVQAFQRTNAPALPFGGPTNVLTNPRDPLGLFR